MPIVKTAVLEDLKDGEYETQFGKVVISSTDSGYKIYIYIDGKKLGRNMAKQIALSMIGPYLREQAV